MIRKTIKIDRFREISSAIKKTDTIPIAHNRRKDETISRDIFSACKVLSRNLNISDEELKGSYILYLKPTNVGSKKWSDIRDNLIFEQVNNVTNLNIITDSSRIPLGSDIIIVY